MSRSVKTRIVSYRTTQGTRRRLGAIAKKQFKQAGLRLNTRNRDHVSLYMGQVTQAIVTGRLVIKPELLAAA